MGYGRVPRAEPEFDPTVAESRYMNRCSCCPTIQAEISAHSSDLVPEYHRWRQGNPDGDLYQSVSRWAVERWGDLPYHSAIGIIVPAIRMSLAPGEPGARRAYRAKPGTTEQRKERLDSALDKLVEQRTVRESRVEI